MTGPSEHGGWEQPRSPRSGTDSAPYPARPPYAPAGYPGPGGPPAGQEPHGNPRYPFPQGEPLPQPRGGRYHAPGPAHGSGGPGSDLDDVRFVRRMKRAPRSGWRRLVYLGTGGLVNPGESPADLRERELSHRVNQPLRGCHRIAMLSLKGGVGKTTVTTALGSTFASLRGDRVIAVDANPDRGTLAQKIPIETTATVRHLLRDADSVTRYSDVRAYTSQGPSRLEVLASESDPAVSEAFSEQDYLRAVALLEHFYNVVLTDCGTGLMHSAMKGVLDSADSLVVVSSGSLDGARSASATLDWLDAHGYGDLVARSVAVINSVRPKAGSVDLDRLAAHFAARVRAVARIPFDAHLEEGAEIDLDRLHPDTRRALLELAATVADGFDTDRFVR
ncbi:MinD/ParA family ATP-binding protein [Saccharomonospora iraqiensis]|uniref:MinD/ParA family ATP-binding protein n=1 Tax=Saccharomonospora iraqiensis TaxID=52698 RepID=UPI00022E11C6|nr:MinD/ParA family protein [Saccharomonospora iraqiensis]